MLESVWEAEECFENINKTSAPLIALIDDNLIENKPVDNFQTEEL